MSPLVCMLLVFMFFVRKAADSFFHFFLLSCKQVRLGAERGSTVVKGAAMILYTLLFSAGISGALPLTCSVLCALTLPIAKLVVKFVEENHKDKEKIFMAKYYCVRLHALFGAALAAGLVLTRVLPKRYVPRLIFSSVILSLDMKS
ncbi:hypothetical protein SLEP1_g43684 [Rubroshorea leprosula]|nr:hypothetical protein SLEP1_g43684 [Rubroshorea leprosula]